MFGNPAHLCIGFEHLFLDGIDPDKPGGHSLVDQGGVIPPAVGITVFDRSPVNQFAFGFEPFHDEFIRIFYKHAFIVGDEGCEFTFCINGAYAGDGVFFPGKAVIFPEKRGNMNDPGTVFCTHILRIDDPVGTFFHKVEALFFRLIFRTFHQVTAFGIFSCEIGKEGFIFHTGKVFALKGADDFRHGIFLIVGTQTCLRHDVEIIAVFDFDVINIRSCGKSHVGRQSPGRGCPGKDIGVFFPDDFETDRYCGIGHFLVALIGFKVGKGGGTAGTVGQDLVPFINQPLIPQILENTPDGFHVSSIHGAVSVFEIHPAAHACHNGFPFGSVAQHNGTACFIEFGDPVFFDLLFTGKIELFFHFIFYGQTVAVPTEGTFAIFAAHSLVTGHNVFDGSGKQVTVVGQTCCKRRSVIDDELLGTFALFQRFFKGGILFPEFQDVVFHFRELDLIGSCFEHFCSALDFMLKCKKILLKTLFDSI